MTIKCAKCGKTLKEWPALAYDAPHPYYCLSEEDQARYVKLYDDDFCVIKYDEQTDYFIRAVLFQQIIDCEEELHYGIWVSLSEKSFTSYHDNFLSDNQQGTYFGYLCNQIPGYNPKKHIRTNVELRQNCERPEVIPHSDQMEIDFVRDYYNGITKEEAERRIAEISLNSSEGEDCKCASVDS